MPPEQWVDAKSLLRGGDAGLHVARQVRHDSDHSLDQHELPSVVHLMFLDRKDHVEAASGRWRPCRRHRNLFCQKILRKSLDPAGPFFAGGSKQLKCLLLCPWHLLFRLEALHECWEVKTGKRSPALLSVNLVLKTVRHRNMRQQFADAARVECRPEAIFIFRDVLSNCKRIFADGAKTLG